MTILTKPSNEKKPEKVALPLVSDVSVPMASAPLPSINGDPEMEPMMFQRRRFSISTTIFLFLSAIAVMLMGILAGFTLYRLYVPSENRMRYHGMCDIPYDSHSLIRRPEIFQLNGDLRGLFPEIFFKNKTSESNEIFTANALTDSDVSDNFFREEYELDLTDEESYAKIDVPNFKDGRRGRFMHDFKENQSAIIDTGAFRCFIMPLDRDTTLPPKNFYDLMQKMRNGYYDIDTDRVKKNMRVVTPELTDLSLVSPRIGRECAGMKVYLLEKYISGVFKREANSLMDSGKFAEFSGKHIVEINLMNINDIEDYEKKQRK